MSKNNIKLKKIERNINIDTIILTILTIILTIILILISILPLSFNTHDGKDDILLLSFNIIASSFSLFSIMIIITAIIMENKYFNKLFKYSYNLLIIFIPLLISISLVGANDFIIDTFKENLIYLYSLGLFFIGISFLLFILYILKNEKNSIIRYSIFIFFSCIVYSILISLFVKISNTSFEKYSKCKMINNFSYHIFNLGLEKKLKNTEEMKKYEEIFYKHIYFIKLLSDKNLDLRYLIRYINDLERKTYYELEKNKSLLNYCGNLDIN